MHAPTGRTDARFASAVRYGPKTSRSRRSAAPYGHVGCPLFTLTHAS